MFRIYSALKVLFADRVLGIVFIRDNYGASDESLRVEHLLAAIVRRPLPRRSSYI